MNVEFHELTKDEAKRIVADVPYDEIHCFIGNGLFLGADWDKDGVLDLVDGANRVAWSPHPLRHDFAVKTGSTVHRFGIRRDES